jgi:hypothetical protein
VKINKVAQNVRTREFSKDKDVLKYMVLTRDHDEAWRQ